MLKNMLQKKFRLWTILAITILVVWGIVIWLLFDGANSNEEVFLDSELKRFEGEVQSTLLTYETFSNYINDQINDNEDVMKIMYEANTATIAEKEVLREKLYEAMSPRYEKMTKYEFRQLHFHLPNTESFLRMHIPEKYGDLLTDVRESVRLVNENKEKITGFEEGRIFNGFRYVFPLNYQEKHVGSVEISLSSASIIEVLAKLYPKEDFHFIIDKEAVEESVFAEELSNYGPSRIFGNYYLDKEVAKLSSAYSTVIINEKEMFFKSFKEKFESKLMDKQSFAVAYSFQGKDYLIKFLSIENIKDEPIAYLISISESQDYGRLVKDMWEQIVLVTILAFLIIVFSLVIFVYQYRLKDTLELDYLTKIYNRSKFYELAKREAKNAERYKYDSSIMMFDIDHFKNINDTYGHAWGDKVLKALASKILESIRETDVFARWGGEEFVLLLPHTKKEEAIQVAEKIRKLIEETDSKELKDITISIGVAELSYDDYNINSAIKQADKAMYMAKEAGRNLVRSL